MAFPMMSKPKVVRIVTYKGTAEAREKREEGNRISGVICLG